MHLMRKYGYYIIVFFLSIYNVIYYKGNIFAVMHLTLLPTSAQTTLQIDFKPVNLK